MQCSLKEALRAKYELAVCAAAMACTGQRVRTVPSLIEALSCRPCVIRTRARAPDSRRLVASVLHDASPTLAKPVVLSRAVIDRKRKVVRQLARTAPSSNSQRLATASACAQKPQLVPARHSATRALLNATGGGAKGPQQHAPKTTTRRLHDLS